MVNRKAAIICAVKVPDSNNPCVSLKGDSLDLLITFIAIGETLMEEHKFSAMDMWSAFDSVIHRNLNK